MAQVLPPVEQARPAPASRPLVAIVGRPNVGKSTLFNALVGRRTAIVSKVAGTTRDRLYGAATYVTSQFLIVDTGGLVPERQTPLETLVTWQVESAIAEAEVIVMLADATAGVMPNDLQIAHRLRQAGKPVVLAVNKVDGLARELLVPEFYRLALGDPIPISAYHHGGIDDLLERVLTLLPTPDELAGKQVEVPHFAIVGRPNVGKSALANAILGMERSIVTETPGTTRDALDTPIAINGRQAVLIDTAGIRRRGSVQPGIEQYSVLRAIRAVDRCSVAMVVLDATEMVTSQDLHIAGQVAGSFKGAVVVVNKWDLVTNQEWDQETVREQVLRRLRFMDYVPVCFTSALAGYGVPKLMDTAHQVYDEWTRWVDPSQLSLVVMRAIAEHLPPKQGSRIMKIYRVKQESSGPPTFVFYCNNPMLVHFSYERYLENVIRAAFEFRGAPLRLEFRGKGKAHVIGAHRAGPRLR